ncbi:hypothetical protein IU451_03380 [Nocardia cyriacigeorgica]|uniref:hypothetical protein n=1 Tax=Nocardia cyriacigeorgica TaxID=135487 RepID=UPI0018937877|nr:hypothetical protein [Nocardia cyriacigeorgica]MBF6321562.1 hypothetical protein [Nocardia cyriacigeorgica]
MNETRLWAWMPYEGGSNRAWIQRELGKRIRPEWNKAEGRWEIARRHLWVLTDAMADRFGEVDLFVQFSTTELCDTRCKNANPATVHDCVCACLGENHGGRGKPRDWQLSGATTLVSHGTIKERYKLIRRGEPRLVPITDETTQQQPEPATPPQPTPAPTVTPKPPTQIQDNSTSTTHRQPVSLAPVPATKPTAEEPVPVGCGIAVFGVVGAVCAVLALAVNGLFWIGVALAVLVALSVVAEWAGLV